MEEITIKFKVPKNNNQKLFDILHNLVTEHNILEWEEITNDDWN